MSHSGTICDRCGEPMSVSTMSRFNQDQICMPCEEGERRHPEYEAARAAEDAEVQKGNMNFPGVGAPADIRLWRGEAVTYRLTAKIYMAKFPKMKVRVAEVEGVEVEVDNWSDIFPRLTEATAKILREKKSKVTGAVLCSEPGLLQVVPFEVVV